MCAAQRGAVVVNAIRLDTLAPAQARFVTLRTRAQYPLTDQQLADFGGKRSLQRRLAELGLDAQGARAELRLRLVDFLNKRSSGAPFP